MVTKRLRPLWLFLLPVVIWSAPEEIPPDGKAAGLSATVFDTLAELRRTQSVTWTPRQVDALLSAFNQDGVLDPNERDLLVELCQSQFRPIQIRRVDAKAGDPTLTLFPARGSGKRTLLRVLYPPLDLEASWSQPDRGLRQIVDETKQFPEDAARVTSFLEGKFAARWALCTPGKHQPFSDLVTELIRLCQQLGSDEDHARNLLYQAAGAADAKAGDEIPDLHYHQLRRGGAL